MITSRNYSNDQSVQFIVGNSYRRLPESEAPLDRSGQYSKIHDWTLYVDVVSGDVDLIERVVFDLGSTFQPQKFICSCPVEITQANGLPGWRFKTRQQTYGPTQATITIRGAGGTAKVVSHSVELSEARKRKKNLVHSFSEPRGALPLRMLKMNDSQRIGIELELSSEPGLDPSTIASRMPRNAGVIQVMDNYRQGRQSYSDGWKIVPDSSLVCSTNMPSCHKFELVSRVLQGGRGLSEVNSVTKALQEVGMLQVNKSMGFHVHVDVSGYTLDQLIKICQNFIKYEDVMDSFMPPSRRNGSSECDSYFQSNRASVEGHTNKQRHLALSHCYNLEELASEMNRNGRYHKLNLQNLVTGRQPTIEFRQHSATLNYDKISAWIRFCVAFVNNSARLKSPSPFQEGRDLDFQFRALFQYVIKDRALRDFYRTRQDAVDRESAACCSSCAHGGSCGRVGSSARPVYRTGFAMVKYN